MPRSPVSLRSVRLGLLVIAGAGLVLGDPVLAQAAPDSAVIRDGPKLQPASSAGYMSADVMRIIRLAYSENGQ